MSLTRLLAACVLCCVLSACGLGGRGQVPGDGTITQGQTAETAPPATENPPEATVAPTPTAYSIPEAFPLSEPGPYFASNTSFVLTDPSRNGREVRVTLWYPARKETDEQGHLKIRDALPDSSRAPYPLVLTDSNTGDTVLQSHLATHGFVLAIVRFPDKYDVWDMGIVDHPRDMVFALAQLASDPPEGLRGIIDADHAGAVGYSWGGFYSLALSGVRISPASYLEWCGNAPAIESELPDWYIPYACGLAGKWADFEAQVGADLATPDDGLWQPITDERIRAVMPMAPDGAWLYGDRGLASADRPALIIEGGEDEQAFEAEHIFTHLGSPDRSMVSFIGKGHMMVLEPDVAARLRHFVTAFFGYHLQGTEAFRDYFSEEFVSQFSDLAWH
jgi:predicted dienelactone hydrolase